MKKLTAVLLTFILVAVCNTAANAANWMEIIRDSRMLIYGDTSSLQYDGRTINVWEKKIPRDERMIKVYSKGFKDRVSYEVTLTQYDVNNKTYRTLFSTSYDKNGNVLGNFNYGEYYKPTQIPPDTVGDYIFNFYKKLLGIK